ncbi:MAG TPA: tRNA (cytidine(34)-2'-O)-methyltransferase [Burkholderiaceae bacterium]|nr:tRNA (cytidine(34)-2'-O)-methyltransferase [Burkholderiaceae bacterium]
MFHIVLVEPEIPPNTGNVIRLAANTGAQLHLVSPLGFDLDDKQLRRAGLDYHEFAAVKVHASFDALLASEKPSAERTFALTTRATRLIRDVEFKPNDWFVFGNETAGLSDTMRRRFQTGQTIRLPMRAGNRSLNLSNAVAVVIFEAWRQANYAGGS